MTARLAEAAAEAGLTVSGWVTPRPEDGLPDRFRSLALLSPDEPRFWPLFRAAPEATDGAPDPLDRWSRRVIGTLACALGGKACFPFGGPPYRPFLAWARRSGRAHVSPATLLVHDSFGLFISYRGAIALEDDPPAEPPRPHPCEGCARPCLTACPVAAITATGYDVPRCKAHLATPEGAACLDGCLVRRACPVGAGRRDPEQSRFHMEAFR